jgi:hypothetical protein
MPNLLLRASALDFPKRGIAEILIKIGHSKESNQGVKKPFKTNFIKHLEIRDLRLQSFACQKTREFSDTLNSTLVCA